MDQAIKFDEFEELFVAHGQVAMHREAHARAAVEHGLGERDIVAVEQPRGVGRVEVVEAVVEGQIRVQAARDVFGRGLVLEGDSVEDVFARDRIEEVGFAHDGVVLPAEAKNPRANFLRFGDAVDAKFAAVVFEQFGEAALNAIVRGFRGPCIQRAVQFPARFALAIAKDGDHFLGQSDDAGRGRIHVARFEVRPAPAHEQEVGGEHGKREEAVVGDEFRHPRAPHSADVPRFICRRLGALWRTVRGQYIQPKRTCAICA